MKYEDANANFRSTKPAKDYCCHTIWRHAVDFLSKARMMITMTTVGDSCRGSLMMSSTLGIKWLRSRDNKTASPRILPLTVITCWTTECIPLSLQAADYEKIRIRDFSPVIYYHATLCQSGICCRRVSAHLTVRPSVCHTQVGMRAAGSM